MRSCFLLDDDDVVSHVSHLARFWWVFIARLCVRSGHFGLHGFGSCLVALIEETHGHVPAVHTKAHTAGPQQQRVSSSSSSASAISSSPAVGKNTFSEREITYCSAWFEKRSIRRVPIGDWDSVFVVVPETSAGRDLWYFWWEAKDFSWSKGNCSPRNEEPRGNYETVWPGSGLPKIEKARDWKRRG